jgi:putative CocE/NonD family hydrolase
MTTRDGVRLDADIYCPAGDGPFPVLLMRQPYGRAIASTVVYGHPQWYAAQGYLVVIQDVRGRGSSEGSFELFAHEVADGYDTVQWAAQLPGSTGRVGMYGFSYQGMTQLYAAQAAPPALVAIAPAMVGYHPYHDWAYENGALVLQAGLGWAIQLAAETARLRGDRDAYTVLRQASRQLPVHGAPCPDVLQRHGPDCFWHDWLAHPHDDAYWQALTPDLSQVDLPMLHVGGWFDPYLRGDVRLYREMAARSQYPQPFWVGPWGHIPWGRKLGDRDFGPQASSPIDRLQVRWFDHWLKGRDTGLMAAAPLQWFDLGQHQWRDLPCWPEGQTQVWQLGSRGLPSLCPQYGYLEPLPEPPASAAATGTGLGTEVVVDTWVHDPWRPVPSLGGHSAIPAGPFERSHLDDRSDVLTYTSEPLTTALTIAGEAIVTLTCQGDAPSFDLSAVLSVVEPDGRVYNVTQGYGRFDHPPGEFQPCTLPLQPTYITLMAGQSLRLSVSAASFPAYSLNPGTGAAAGESDPALAQIVTLNLACGPGSGSCLRAEGVTKVLEPLVVKALRK